MSLRVTAASGLITVQDRGRVGYAHLGVPRAGALDRPAAALANRLVGNGVDAALLEVTFGSLALRSDVGRWVAVTGARCEVHVEGAIRSHGQAVWIPAEGQLQIGSPQEGMRVYVAVGGGVAVEPVLGSRATDTLAWVGPPRVDVGRVLPVGEAVGAPVEHETPRPPLRGPLRVRPGPRADWFPARAWEELVGSAYVVTPESNRIGLRLAGSQLSRSRAGELLSEGIVLGSIQVPPDGQPVLFLADHPTTGGYPVIGVVEADDLWQCAQVRPGESLLFTVA